MKTYQPDQNGFYRQFGGQFVPEVLAKNFETLTKSYLELTKTEEFQQEFRSLLKDYVGRPSPLFLSDRLSKKYGRKIYLKREDLNFTGAHKINNAIGQILLAKQMGCKRIIAETGAGQHGVATATVCAFMGMECTVVMGAVDIERQQPNVQKMKMLGAEIVPATKGEATLNEAVDLALDMWAEKPNEYFYLLGSAVGPHPYPQMVAEFQSVISEEIRKQLLEKEGKETPDAVIACIGGGSNAIGAFYHFIDDKKVRLIVAEAGGMGVDSGKTAASMTAGVEKILHGSKTMVLVDQNDNPMEAYSISAGLDYPGVGPLPAAMAHDKRMEVIPVNDDQAIEAALDLIRHEGIIPAIESAHALALIPIVAPTVPQNGIIVINLSGRGDKDMKLYLAQQ